jgi:hypothetical protein
MARREAIPTNSKSQRQFHQLPGLKDGTCRGVVNLFLCNLERAKRIEPATFSLRIKITAPLFSQLTKPLRKNPCACDRVPCMQCLICISLNDVWGRFLSHEIFDRIRPDLSALSGAL